MEQLRRPLAFHFPQISGKDRSEIRDKIASGIFQAQHPELAQLLLSEPTHLEKADEYLELLNEQVKIHTTAIHDLNDEQLRLFEEHERLVASLDQFTPKPKAQPSPKDTEML